MIHAKDGNYYYIGTIRTQSTPSFLLLWLVLLSLISTEVQLFSSTKYR